MVTQPNLVNLTDCIGHSWIGIIVFLTFCFTAFVYCCKTDTILGDTVTWKKNITKSNERQRMCAVILCFSAIFHCIHIGTVKQNAVKYSHAVYVSSVYGQVKICQIRWTNILKGNYRAQHDPCTIPTESSGIRMKTAFLLSFFARCFLLLYQF